VGYFIVKLKRWLGGYTGDTLGAVQQLSEVSFYLGLLAVL
jgi:adenosylcobinamide-GDP ribazoletransferase